MRNDGVSKAMQARIDRWARRRIAPVLAGARNEHESGGKWSRVAPYDAVAICLGLREDGADEVSIPIWAAEALVREGERIAFEGPTKGQASRLRDAQIVHFMRQGMDRKAVARKMRVSVKAVDRARRNGLGYYSLLVHRQCLPRGSETHPEEFSGASLLGWDLDGRESRVPQGKLTRRGARTPRRSSRRPPRGRGRGPSRRSSR